MELDPATEWLMRCDRVDFDPGGIALRHTHPGPGIRRLLVGEIAIEGRVETYGPGDAFVGVVLLSVEHAGRRTIRHVDPPDAGGPGSRATIFLEQPVRA